MTTLTAEALLAMVKQFPPPEPDQNAFLLRNLCP